jgi:hypothetical protein
MNADAELHTADAGQDVVTRLSIANILGAGTRRSPAC